MQDFGRPFESRLEARHRTVDGGSRLAFVLRVKPLMPIVFAVVLATTVWPGVWLTDSMLRTYWTGYDFKTWMWYLPLTAPFCPWAMLSAVRKSRASAREEARELIQAIAGHLDGRVEPPNPA